MENEIGINLLMNPKKRAASRASDNSHVTSIEDLEDMIKTANNGNTSKPASKTISSSSGSSSASSTISSSSASSSSYSSSASSGSSSSVSGNAVPRKKYSQDEILNMKREYLYKFDRLEKKGVPLPKKFTLASNLDEMKAEYERLENDRRADVSIQFQRQMLMAFVSGIEMLNDKFDPFDIRLHGWSENVYDQISSYDEIFEELHEKWKGTSQMAPELRLMFSLGGSAFLFHLRQSMFKSSLPPNSAETRVKRQPAASASPLGGLMGSLGGLGGLVGNLFGGGSQAPSAPIPPQQRTTMRGPSDVDDILKEMNQQQDRVEMMSTISESEISSLHDDMSSVTKNIYSKRGRKAAPTKRTMNL